MGKISSFTFITLNGFYKGPNEDISWHQHNNSAGKFANEASASNSILLFGRKTYEMMYSFWPTEAAAEMFPVVARNMNKAAKIVCSNTLKTVHWNNTTLIKGDIVSQLKEFKKTKRKEITILGSGSLLSLLTDANLIDEYRIMLDPVAIGKGTPIFDHIHHQLDLQLTSHKVFKKDGILLLTYQRG